MDELPLIIHRLSLRLFNKEYGGKENDAKEMDTQISEPEEKAVDPFASPPQDPVDLSGNVLDVSQIASLSLDPGSEMHALFSQKNLLRLGALTDSHRTLSLFTPSIRDTVFRAWAGPTERGEPRGSSGRATPALPRSQSYSGNMSTKYVFSDTAAGSHSTRPTLSRFGSAASGVSAGPSRHTKSHGRKKKHRVVNLRKKAFEGDDVGSVSGESTITSDTGTKSIGSTSSAPLEYGARPKTPEMREPGDADVGQTPPRLREATPRQPAEEISLDNTPRVPQFLSYPSNLQGEVSTEVSARPSLPRSKTLQPTQNEIKMPAERDPTDMSSRFAAPLKQFDTSPLIGSPPPPSETSSEHAWMTKIASEILQKVQDQKDADSGFWNRNGRDEDPPPAYGT